MTDKQIIDGKECRYWFRYNTDDYRKCSLRGKDDNCDEIKDCFVKELLGKLAQKEQECEELKKERDTLSVTRNKLLGDLWVTEENLKDYMEHFNKASDELDQLKQTLTEIKELRK